MKCDVILSKAGMRDIDRMSDEIFDVSLDKNTAIEYVDKMLEKINNLAYFPESGTPLYFDNRLTKYRFIVYKSYMAFYRITDNTIIIDRILFGRSDYHKELLSGDN